jgi:hypothetical protein
MLSIAGARAADGLAGRTVWCATALPGARSAARTMQSFFDDTAGGLAAERLDVPAQPPLMELAERLERMLGGHPSRQPLGWAEHELFREAAGDGDGLVGRSVGPEDVVVVHDALSALLVQAVRERGAHAVWRITVAAPSREAAAAQARAFLNDFTGAVDAYMLSWSEPAMQGGFVDRVAALIPRAGVATAKEIPVRHDDAGTREVAMRSVLADVVQGDRSDTVGGTVHARPAVAAR